MARSKEELKLSAWDRAAHLTCFKSSRVSSFNGQPLVSATWTAAPDRPWASRNGTWKYGCNVAHRSIENKSASSKIMFFTSTSCRFLAIFKRSGVRHRLSGQVSSTLILRHLRSEEIWNSALFLRTEKGAFQKKKLLKPEELENDGSSF